MGLGLLLIIVVAVIILLDGDAIIKRLVSNNDSTSLEGVNNPMEILNARLARGELDLDEYQSIRKAMENTEENL